MLAIIPARGGSKGIIKKNIVDFAGKPLIQWTIEAAKKSKHIDRIILSTDDQEIATVCKSMGVEIPFLRPVELARAESMAIDNYIYTIDRLNRDYSNGYQEFVVLLPTSPLRTASDIDSAIKIFYDKDADSVISISKLHHPFEWILSLKDSGKVQPQKNIKLKQMMNRQESQKYYLPNGAIYVFKLQLLKKKYSYYSKNTFGYKMPVERSIDIDTEYDLDYAKYIYNRLFIKNES
tara:strand:- start:2173 stop:2877 length:705 start_codon:yes stop_codon:yes gene_type:complete